MMKKLVVLLVGLMLLSMSGMAFEPTQHVMTEADIQDHYDYLIASVEDTFPELAAHYEKWRYAGVEYPIPAEWEENGKIIEGVTAEMLNERLHGSLFEQMVMEEPRQDGRYVQSMYFILHEDRTAELFMACPLVGHEVDVATAEANNWYY